LNEAIHVFLSRDPSFVIACAGRQADERAYVVVERGVLKGYAFVSYEVSDFDSLDFHLKPLPHSENTSAIMEAFASGRWGYKRIELTNHLA
jgi:hypothetical protein